MKKFFTFIFVLSLVSYTGGLVAYAQGKSGGHNPSATGHGPDHADQGRTHQAESHEPKDHKDHNFESRIESNPQLKANVTSLLPAGMTLKTAAMGFRNQGQFIAALHVSKNLNIPFDQLKAKLTGDHPESLGKAIQDLRPKLTEQQAKAEAEKAEKQAKETEKTKAKPIT